MKTILYIALFFYGVFGCVAPSRAGVHFLSNSAGQLVGVNGIIINGTSYDVRFNDGTCAEAFGGCDQAHFLFSSRDAAVNAGLALAYQAFQGKEPYDSRPDLTLGCSLQSECYAFIPYGNPFVSNQEGVINFAQALNRSYGGNTAYYGGFFRLSSSLTNYYQATWAVFSLSHISLVPEADCWILLIMGFSAVGFSVRQTSSHRSLSHRPMASF